MGKLLLKCSNCHSYTFKTLVDGLEEELKICPYCSGELKTPHPPKFSMDNKYRVYLRKLKYETQK